MTTIEAIVIVGGLILGYGIVTVTYKTTPSKGQSTNYSKDDAKSRKSDNKSSGNSNSDETDDIFANWFRILDVTEDASLEQLTKAYKQKIRQYHPDKVAQMGTEIRELAEFKSKQINTAYDYAMKLRR